MNIKRNIVVDGNHGKPLLVDVYSPQSPGKKPVVIFAHGFKGFKDWGIWDLLAKGMVEAGYVFLKFNFSHNGTSPETPLDFSDLEAFGENNYTKELADLDLILNYLEEGSFLARSELNLDRLTIIGHSRGGGITAVKAASDARIKAWLGWASVAHLDYAWREKTDLIENWKKTGVLEILNGRTKQMMPLYYQLYEDFCAKASLYSVEQSIRNMKKPMLLIHGTMDPVVPVEVTKDFNKWNRDLEVTLIPEANHVFGGSHPYKAEALPPHAQILLERSLSFLKKV